MAAPPAIRELVSTFARNRDSYRSDAFNELQLRHQFLNPFFASLGWDVENRQGYAEAYKDVVLEESIKVGGATRAPDYSFRIGGVRNLRGFEKELRARYEVRRGDYDWWVIRQVANIDIFDNQKLVYPDLCSKPKFALNLDGTYPNNTVFCIPADNLALLSFLNSRLAWYWITLTCPANRGGAYRLFNQYINHLPVRDDVLQHSKLAAMGRGMVAVHEQLSEVKASHERTVLQRQIETTDREIDRLVYELYGLTDDEIRIVEEATAKP